ncbi:zinc finger protein ZAT8-like [Oryza brachyantha]|uniref:zinc finger protein ZAT8-like n=1 Tax=Oryza brachyantha TaxID=4533 RepID=UPI001ADAE3DC|nr:zinc finger protein ZAT8-like [Oryza brachyantha]
MTITREEAESKEMESLRVHASALLSLSSPAPTASTPAERRALAAEGVFECKTCNKRFPSFQALGGHRTSHTRLQAKMLNDPAAAAAAAAERDRARVHECTVCGLEFSMGQALGGHMRRHRGEPGAAVVITDTDSGGTSVPQPPAEAMPDLNYPPLEDAGDGQESSSGRSSEPELLNLLV